jgi:hypothetical protein
MRAALMRAASFGQHLFPIFIASFDKLVLFVTAVNLQLQAMRANLEPDAPTRRTVKLLHGS